MGVYINMINTIIELQEIISKSNTISKEATDILLELDTTSSTATRARLNDMLVEIYNRLKNNERITFEILNKVITAEELNKWINSELTEYSVRLFNETINN